MNRSPRLNFIVIIILAITFPLSGCASSGIIRFKSAPANEKSIQVRGELHWPKGDGPFPAVIVLHGCGGIDGHYRDWAARIADWGYVAFLIDSFSDRGFRNICSTPRKVSKMDRALDIFGAARHLQQLPNVDHDNIGVLGSSHGGGAVLHAVQKNTPYAAKMDTFPFKAAIAFYPWCDVSTDINMAVSTLILTGEKDDWTPSDRCILLERMIYKQDLLELVVYSGAHHAFDRPKHTRTYLGHRLECDPTATQQARRRAKEFLDHHLKRSTP